MSGDGRMLWREGQGGAAQEFLDHATLANQEASHRPSWPGGVAAALRKRREATLAPQTGWWFRFKRILSIKNHHPVRSIKGGFAAFS